MKEEGKPTTITPHLQTPPHILIVALALLPACASTQDTHMLTAEKNLSFSASSAESLLMIFRADSFLGSASPIDNFVDGRFVGQTRGRVYYTVHLPPGDHYIMTRLAKENWYKNIFVARMRFMAGKTYFIEQSWSSTYQGGQPLLPAPRDRALQTVASSAYEYQQANPAGLETHLTAEEFFQAKADFDREAQQNPAKYRDFFEYPGY